MPKQAEVGGCDGNVGGSFFQYFDTSCFVNPPDDGDGIADFRGNAGRNILRMPGINNWDLSIFRKFAIGESRSLDFRWEMFNGFNHPQWSSVTTWNDMGINPLSTFGRIGGGRPGRRASPGSSSGSAIGYVRSVSLWRSGVENTIPEGASSPVAKEGLCPA